MIGIASSGRFSASGRRFGFLPQSKSLADRLACRTEIELFARLRNVSAIEQHTHHERVNVRLADVRGAPELVLLGTTRNDW